MNTAIYIGEKAITTTTVKYGYLYNWYAATDARNIANTGWHVPSNTEINTLISFTGGSTIAGNNLKESGTTYWSEDHGVNSVSFNGRGAGRRTDLQFNFIKGSSGHWSSQTGSFGAVLLMTSELGNVSIQNQFKYNGFGLRLMKDSTTLSDGQESTMTGNDGKVYRTICIGTQEWLADNLSETKYRNGDDIPTETDQTTWAGLTTGAKCAYDNDEDNAFDQTTIEVSNRLDLFEDENISITSSVLDIQDISKNTTDYTKSFTVPASDKNNQIFKHYYDANIDNTFDARVSVDGRIEIGGVLFRKGKILLQKVEVKSGRASNYTINFWGNLVSLKEVLGDDKLSDLDLSIHDFQYNPQMTFILLNQDSVGNSVIANLLVKKQYYYSSDPSDSTMTDELANIHYRPTGANGVAWDDITPSMRLNRIIEALGAAPYNLTFSDDFFGRNEFNELFMWLNNSEDSKSGGNDVDVDFNSGFNTFIDFNTNIGTFITYGEPFSAVSSNFALGLTIIPDAGYEEVEYTINFYSEADVLSGKVTGTGQQLLNSTLNSLKYNNESHTYYSYWEISSTEAFNYTATLDQLKYTNGAVGIVLETYGDDTIASVFEISKHIPDIKIIDFLKGLFNAFKLVIIPQDDGTLYVNTVKDYYAQGQLINVTNYVDVESVKVSRGSILNTIEYKFEEPQTILNKTFKQNNSLAYGDEDVQLKDDNGDLLDGDSLEIELPFEQVVYERLSDEFTSTPIGVLYGAIIDNNLSPTNIKPHIFYNTRQTVGGDGIGFIDNVGTKFAITGAINTPSHLIDITNPSHSFVFSEEANEWDGQIIENTLYSNYHKEYIDNVFNVKRRNYTFTTDILPVPILLKLTLNDILKIGYNYYRVDKFTTDLTNGKTELNLVNAFEFDLASFVSDDTYITLNFDPQTYSTYVANLTTYTSLKTDLGHGTGWLTVGDNGAGFLEFTVTRNELEYRDIQVDITDDVTGTTISYYVGQKKGGIGQMVIGTSFIII